MPRDEIDRQKVADLYREWRRQRAAREDLDAKLSALSPAEREHYYDLIARTDQAKYYDNRQRGGCLPYEREES